MRWTSPLTICLAASPLAAAEPMRCAADPTFRVEAVNTRTVELTCKSAAAARTILQSCGVGLTDQIDILVTDNISGALGKCLGVYHCGENLIEILSPQTMPIARDADSAFAGIPDGDFWESVLVHELTHAAYDKVKCAFSSCVATSEYVAYAMQVYALSQENRELFGQNVTLRGKPSRDAISAMVYFMAPDRFAKITWLHFSERPDPCGYLSLIMDGQIFFDREPL